MTVMKSQVLRMYNILYIYMSHTYFPVPLSPLCGTWYAVHETRLHALNMFFHLVVLLIHNTKYPAHQGNQNGKQ